VVKIKGDSPACVGLGVGMVVDAIATSEADKGLLVAVPRAHDRRQIASVTTSERVAERGYSKPWE
jgi:hypothetical protein